METMIDSTDVKKNPLEKIDPPIIYMMFGGSILALINQSMRSTLPPDRYWLTYLFMAFGLGLFVLGAYCVEQKRVPQLISSFLSTSSAFFKISQNQVVSLIFAIAFGITGTIAAGGEAYLYNAVASILSWAISIFLVVFAGWDKKPVSIRPFNRALLWAIVLFFVALSLRAFNTTIYPNALSGDEASAGLFSVCFIKDLTNNIFTVGWFSFPAFFFFLQSIGIRILGQTVPGIRVTSAVVGALTVLTLYLFVRAAFNSRTALIASILLAFSHYHINFSRIALNNVWDGLGFVVTLGALWWAWNRERKAAFILAGLALGLSQYFYSSARGLLAVVPLWIICVGFQDKQRFRRLLPHIILMFISALIAILPLAWFFLMRPDEFMAPMLRVSILGDWLAQTSINTGKPIWLLLFNQLTTSLLVFTDKPLLAWYTPGTALLRPISAWLFYLSLGLILFKLKDNRIWLIFLWLLVFVFTGLFSQETPAAQRYVAAVPACFIIVGYGINKLIELLENLWEKKRRFISSMAMILVLLIAVDDARFYFYDYSPTSDFGGYHTQLSQRLANYLQNYDSSWEVLFSGWPEMGYFSISSIPYLAPQIKGVDIFKKWGDPDNAVPDYKNVMFVFLPVRELDLYKCMYQYPGGTLIKEYQQGQLLYYLYKVQFP